MKVLEIVNKGTRIYYNDTDLNKNTNITISTDSLSLTDLKLQDDINKLFCRVDFSKQNNFYILDIILELDNRKVYSNFESKNNLFTQDSTISFNDFLKNKIETHPIKYSVTTNNFFKQILFSNPHYNSKLALEELTDDTGNKLFAEENYSNIEYENIPFVCKENNGIFEYVFYTDKIGSFKFVL